MRTQTQVRYTLRESSDWFVFYCCPECRQSWDKPQMHSCGLEVHGPSVQLQYNLKHCHKGKVLFFFTARAHSTYSYQAVLGKLSVYEIVFIMFFFFFKKKCQSVIYTLQRIFMSPLHWTNIKLTLSKMVIILVWYCNIFHVIYL